jgi:long-chain acyl-CoA synthetase
MTETGGPIAFTGVNDDCNGSVGRPVPANETKLVDVPEMGYFANSTPPTGEVCVRGPSVFQGYYKDTEKTYARSLHPASFVLSNSELRLHSLQVFDSEGWFHTGDVARRNEDGTLTLIDRKKNLFKLSQGEYIAFV